MSRQVEPPLRVDIRILREVREELRRHHAVGAVTGIDALQPVEAGEQQPCANEEHDRDRHLRDDERALQSTAPARFRRRLCCPVSSRQPDRLATPARGRCRTATPVTIDTSTREQQHAAVDRDLAGSRREPRHERGQQARRPRGEQQPDGSAGERQQRAFGQQLADEAPIGRRRARTARRTRGRDAGAAPASGWRRSRTQSAARGRSSPAGSAASAARCASSPRALRASSP